MINKKYLIYLLKRDFRLVLCLLLFDGMMMPLLAVNFPDLLNPDASGFFNLIFSYLLVIIVILVQRQLGFVTKRAEKISLSQLPMTKRSLILTRLGAGVLIYLVPFLIAWVGMGISFVFSQDATGISILQSLILLIGAMIIDLSFCSFVFYRSRNHFQALFTILVWTLAPVFVVSALVAVMRATAIYWQQCDWFFNMLHDFATLTGFFTQAAKILILDSKIPAFSICLLLDGVAVIVSLGLLFRITDNNSQNEHRTLTQTALFKLMPALTAAPLLVVSALTAAKPQEKFIFIVLSIVLYLLIQFISTAKIQFHRRMIGILFLEFLLIQGVTWSWRFTGGWGMTHAIEENSIFFINHYAGIGKKESYYMEFSVLKTATMSAESKRMLVEVQQQAEQRYRRQGLNGSTGFIQIVYRLQVDQIELVIPYYSDLVEPLLEELDAQRTEVHTMIRTENIYQNHYFGMDRFNIQIF